MSLWLAILIAAPLPGKPASTPVSEDAAAVDALLARIADAATARTAFVEQRTSKLLDRPLIVSGFLERGPRGALTRRVVSPHAEIARIEGGRVEVERDGRRRSFRLDRAPELAAALAAFDALLAGDSARLRESHRVQLRQQGARWTILLSPIAQARARNPIRMQLHGINSGLRCVVTWQREVESSRMLLGAEVGSKPDFMSDCVDVDD